MARCSRMDSFVSSSVMLQLQPTGLELTEVCEILLQINEPTLGYSVLPNQSCDWGPCWVAVLLRAHLGCPLVDYEGYQGPHCLLRLKHCYYCVDLRFGFWKEPDLERLNCSVDRQLHLCRKAAPSFDNLQSGLRWSTVGSTQRASSHCCHQLPHHLHWH